LRQFAVISELVPPQSLLLSLQIALRFDHLTLEEVGGAGGLRLAGTRILLDEESRDPISHLRGNHGIRTAIRYPKRARPISAPSLLQCQRDIPPHKLDYFLLQPLRPLIPV